MLGGVASFLMTQNSRFLIGKSIPQKQVLAIQDHLGTPPLALSIVYFHLKSCILPSKASTM
jgi:hypothetical protein